MLGWSADVPPLSHPAASAGESEHSKVNFKKLMLIVVPLALLVVGYQYLTGVNHGDAVEVAKAFTKAMKAGDLSAAGKYYVPAEAEAWEGSFTGMKSGARERFRERIPADPAFTPATTDAKGVTTVSSADKSYSLEMKQIDGRWYVARNPG